MIPKEKSEELFKTYVLICNNWSLKFIEFKTIKELKKELNQQEWFIPKQCALIAVDELIYSHSQDTTDNQFYYWNDVKKEIEKL